MPGKISYYPVLPDSIDDSPFGTMAVPVDSSSIRFSMRVSADNATTRAITRRIRGGKRGNLFFNEPFIRRLPANEGREGSGVETAAR